MIIIANANFANDGSTLVALIYWGLFWGLIAGLLVYMAGGFFKQQVMIRLLEAFVSSIGTFLFVSTSLTWMVSSLLPSAAQDMAALYRVIGTTEPVATGLSYKTLCRALDDGCTKSTIEDMEHGRF
jgi:hypothetical protein